MHWRKTSLISPETDAVVFFAAENYFIMLNKEPKQWLVDLYLICLQVGSEGVLLIAKLPMELYLAYLPCVNGPTKSCCCGTTLQWLTISCVLFKGSGFSSRSRTGRDKYGPPVRTEYRLVVENLSSRCSWQDLKVYLESDSLLVHVYTSISPVAFLSHQDFMRQAGEVTYADAHKERTNEGVIEFRSYSDMKRALDKLDGTDINGRKIRLVEDRPRRGRSYSGSRSRYELFCGTSSLFF